MFDNIFLVCGRGCGVASGVVEFNHKVYSRFIQCIIDQIMLFSIGTKMKEKMQLDDNSS